VLDNYERKWGTPEGVEIMLRAPSVAGNAEAERRMAAYYRASASPGAVLAIMKMNREIDVRGILSSIRVPTLILHRAAEHVSEIGHARYLAQHIPGAKLVELPGEDHVPWIGDRDAIVDEVEEFLTGARQGPDPERVLATVLFVDIAGSTERAVALGDSAWRELLEAFQGKVREVLRQFRGREIDMAGDGFLAAFDGPARAIRCAGTIRDAVRALGIELRCGVHTGECERTGEKLAGIAVHIGARVAALAEPGEILVSQTVRDLVAGSGLAFDERGASVLKGVPGEWRLFRAR
jgi:class 3 adenylate cyclase